MQTADEARQRAAFSARMQRLPVGVEEVVPPQHGAACHVCNEEDETEDNNLLQVWPLLQGRSAYAA